MTDQDIDRNMKGIESFTFGTALLTIATGLLIFLFENPTGNMNLDGSIKIWFVFALPMILLASRSLQLSAYLTMNTRDTRLMSWAITWVLALVITGGYAATNIFGFVDFKWTPPMLQQGVPQSNSEVSNN